MWSVTDTDLVQLPNGPLLLYTSLNPVAHIINPTNGNDLSFDLSDFPLSTKDQKYLRILSMRFSNDGSEVIAGCTNGGMCMYFLKLLLAMT